MFDIAWSEMIIIGGVALVVLGPKDLPKALRAVGAMTAKARRMAAEFQEHFREAMREAELEGVRQEVANIHQDLSTTTSGLQSDFNSIGSQMPSSPEPVVQPASPNVEAAPAFPGEPGPVEAEKTERQEAAQKEGARGEKAPAAQEAPSLSVEASPAAVIVTETAKASPSEMSSVDPSNSEKPKRKRRSAAKLKASDDPSAQGSLEIDPQSGSEIRPKPRRRAAKTSPPGDDRPA
ncbi:MAG: twin-arginine translocase subunit TatB [Hyphomicrobiales bacterium]|nr:twin-arginine translocase subunit TatB [Hyphomicrobiales bacterium]